MINKLFLLNNFFLKTNPFFLVNNFFDNIFSGDLFFDLSLVLIALSALLLIVSFAITIFLARKTKEEKIADSILTMVRSNKPNNKTKKEQEPVTKTKKTDLNLKQVLVEKFQPIIEKQLKSDIEIVDIKASKQNFVTKIIVQNNDLELVLDSSGKIVDYKRL